MNCVIKYIIFFIMTAALILSDSAALQSASTSFDENNSAALADDLILKIMQNPAGDTVPLYINKLIEITPAVGRIRVADVFNAAVKKLHDDGNSGNPVSNLLKLSIDELNGSHSECIKNFSFIKRWNVSGPWKIYGSLDMDYQFSPEKVFKFDDIEKGRNISADENGHVSPFKSDHQADETVYAVSSFTASAGIVLWIQTDADYKLIINGREILQNVSDGKKSINSLVLRGARGYTIQIKMLSGGVNHQPRLRGMITDENNLPVKINNSNAVFNYSFTADKIFSLKGAEESVPLEASLLTGRMKDLVRSGNYISGYKLGVMIIEKFPQYYPVYRELIPLLDNMNRDDEFNVYIEKFIKLFPSSDIQHRWRADFYMTREKKKFREIMESMPLRYFSNESVESYIFLLCGDKRYSEAIKLCSSLEYNQRISRILPEIIRASGDNESWRRSLIEGAAFHDEAYFYYALGLSEMQIGLDPVMYWEKGASLEDSSLMRDISGLYENGILGANDFYTGAYTDFHPEFRRYAKKRKIRIHLYESGRVILEGEDIIPPGNKIRKEKYSESGNEFSSGEMKIAVPFLKGIKILYVLTAKDGLPSVTDFKSEPDNLNRLTVNYKSNGDEEFSVIKYSGEYLKDEDDVFSLMKKLILKKENENISELDYEVIYHGSFTPLVRYNGKPLTPGKYSDGAVKFHSSERFTDGDVDAVSSDIERFSSEKVFAGWYSNLITYAGKIPADKSTGLSEKNDIGNAAKEVHLYIMSSISKRGSIDFSPRKMDVVLTDGQGTVEERALCAKGVFESMGIKSFIAFKKNGGGLINKILLYVPGDRGSGFWLDFYGESISDKMESGSEALVITGEGFETFPVNPETYIR